MSPAPAAFDAGRLERLGLDPAWSRIAEVELADGASARVHALDILPTVTPPPLTVVCVHGNPTWSFLWRSFHRRLGDRYRVIAVDQLSMGLSQRVAPRRFAQRVDDLGRILDAFGVEGPIVLAAHDWGGPIALGWAVEHRERVAGILLGNTGVSLPAGGVPLPIRLAGSEVLRDLGCRRTSAFIDVTLATGHGRIDRGARRGYRAPYRSSANRRAIADFVEDIPTTPEHPSFAALAAMTERLPELDVPVLLAWGENDPVFHLEFAADLRCRLPQAELHRFPLAGHLVIEEEDVAAVADAWIGRLLEPGDQTTAGPALSPVSTEPLWGALLAREADQAIAVAVGGGSTLTFAELARRVAGLACALREAGVVEGDRVALLAPDPQDFIAAAYACWVIGAVTVVVDRGLGLKGLRRALRSSEPAWLVGTRKTLGVARVLRWASSARRLEVEALDRCGATLSAVVAETALAADVPAAVVYTSGATGPPKGVLYDQCQMAAQFLAVRECYAIGSGDRLVAAFAPFALYGPALGIPVAVPDCDITRPGSLRADRLAEACAAIDATIVFAAPAALEGVIATAESLSREGRTALAALRLVLSAGAPVSPRTLRSFAALAPASELHTPYGMTEVLSVADIDLAALEAIGPGRGVCVGHPLSGVEVRIEPLAGGGGGGSGEIVVSAPWLSTGYDGLWAATNRARSVDSHGTEWHRTGDVGHLDEAGRLWVEGRMAHVVRTAAGPVTSVPLEVAIETALGLRSAVSGVGPDSCAQVVVVVEQAGKAGLADGELDGKVRTAVAPQAIAAVLTVPALPVDRRHNSKIDRTRLGLWADALLSGGKAPGRP